MQPQPRPPLIGFLGLPETVAVIRDCWMRKTGAQRIMVTDQGWEVLPVDQSMYALDIAVAAVLAGLMIAYNLHKRKEIEDMRVGDVFDCRRYFLIANIITILYALIAVAGLSVSFFFFPPAHWITMMVLAAFMIVDLIRVLLRVHSLRKQSSVAATVIAPEVRNAGLWMMVYTILQIANLFYFI